MAMRYEWDEAKRVGNLGRHGVDFAAARDFDWETAAVVEDRRRRYGEVRLIALGLVAGRLHVLVYTRRSGARRIISFRKANRREQATYAAARADRG